MRKRCKRVSRPVSTLITPAQHMALMLKPRMHLELILSQTIDLDYQRSVLSVFNLAAALAFLQNKPQTQSQFEAAQRVMSLLIQGARGPSPEEGDFLRLSFNQADRHFGIQSGAALARALDVVDQARADSETTDKKGSEQ